MGLVKAHNLSVGLDSFYNFQRHIFQVKGNTERGTNNEGGFKALYYLLEYDLDRGIDNLKSMGDFIYGHKLDESKPSSTK
jgi:hypothetical protein